MSEAVAKALSHPLRAQILGRLGERPGSAKQLSEEFDCRLSNTSYHVRKLHDLGLIELVKKVRKRGATERIYMAVREAPGGTLARKDVPRSVRDHVSAPTMQKIIDSGIGALELGTLDARDDSHLACISAVLDLDGWKEVAAAMDRALTTIETTRRRSGRRLAKAREQGIETTIFFGSFESPDPEREREEDDQPPPSPRPPVSGEDGERG